MTCGVCSPKAFRPNPGKRVWGYLTATDMHIATIQARKLYFMGAEAVLSDTPGTTFDDRPGWQFLSKPLYLRDGDRLILSKHDDLDANPDIAQGRIEALTARGVEVFILQPEYFEGEESPTCL